MKALALTVAALAAASWTYAAENRTEAGTVPAVETTETTTEGAVQGVEGERAWVERRIGIVRGDIDRFDKRLESSTADEKSRERNREKLTALKDRLSRLEERFKNETGDEQAFVIEEELYMIEDDLNHLRRDSKVGRGGGESRGMERERR